MTHQVFKEKGQSNYYQCHFQDKREEYACQEIALFFYNNVIPFNTSNGEEFKRVLEFKCF